MTRSGSVALCWVGLYYMAYEPSMRQHLQAQTDPADSL